MHHFTEELRSICTRDLARNKDKFREANRLFNIYFPSGVSETWLYSNQHHMWQELGLRPVVDDIIVHKYGLSKIYTEIYLCGAVVTKNGEPVTQIFNQGIEFSPDNKITINIEHIESDPGFSGLGLGKALIKAHHDFLLAHEPNGAIKAEPSSKNGYIGAAYWAKLYFDFENNKARNKVAQSFAAFITRQKKENQEELLAEVEKCCYPYQFYAIDDGKTYVPNGRRASRPLNFGAWLLGSGEVSGYSAKWEKEYANPEHPIYQGCSALLGDNAFVYEQLNKELQPAMQDKLR